MSDRVYTRAEILDALAIEPCHVTGMHDPTHTTRSVCNIQESEALDRLLSFLGVTVKDLPRRLHPEGPYSDGGCGWCHTHNSEEDRAALVAWATTDPRPPKAVDSAEIAPKGGPDAA